MESFIPITIALLLQAVTAQNSSLITVSPFVIPGDSTNSCPQTEERISARENLKNEVLNVLIGITSSIDGDSRTSTTVTECGEGQWYRIAHLNMSSPSEHCPSVWNEYTTPVRTCGRQVSSGTSCSPNIYSSNGYRYSKVCGRVLGYGFGFTNAFDTGTSPSSLNDIYVEGLSITHGVQPRTHIWTYAAGNFENGGYLGSCPCIGGGNGVRPPSFIGENYHCESGNTRPGGPGLVFITDDVLWDGIRCEGGCCDRSPPWFSITLPVPTTDDIEVRICGVGANTFEDTPIQLLEIYSQ